MNETQEPKNKDIRRNLGEARESGLPSMRAEIVSRVVAERFPNASETYRHQWYKRFLYGDEWHSADDLTKGVILKVLTTSWGGTAKCIDIDTMRTFIGQRGDFSPSSCEHRHRVTGEQCLREAGHKDDHTTAEQHVSKYGTTRGEE